MLFYIYQFKIIILGNQIKGMINKILIIIFISVSQISLGQWNKSGNPFYGNQSRNSSNMQIGGFLRFVNYQQYSKWNDDRFSDYAIHNKLYLYNKFDRYNSFYGSIQNRLIFGEAYNLNTSGYANSLLQNNDLLNLSFIIKEENNYLIHSEIDLLYYKWESQVFRFKLGRQRYYWNQSLVWNPNNYLNTYSVLGYDVINRSGLESVSLSYKLGGRKSKWTMDLVYAPHKTIDESIITSRLFYKNNRSEFQIVGGSILDDFSGGLGFTTYIRETGLSGEVTYFNAKNEEGYNALLVDLSTYYRFPSKVFVSAEALYHSNPQENTSPTNIFTNRSVKHLITNEFQIAGIMQYPIHKSTTLGSSVLYYFDDEYTTVNAFILVDITKTMEFYLSYNVFGQTQNVVDGNSRKYLLGQLAISF